MTRDEILAMKAGRELDALVAEKVMGVKNMEQWLINHRMDETGQYSTDIAAAWEVVEKMRQRFRDSSKTVLFGCHENLAGNWTAYWYQSTDTMPPQWEAISESLPEAISKAALLAVMRL